MFSRISTAVLVFRVCSALIAQPTPRKTSRPPSKKLARPDGYSLATTSKAAFNSKTEGKTQKDGLTQLSMTLRDQHGRDRDQGDKAAVTTEDAGNSAAEAADGEAPSGFLGRMARTSRPRTRAGQGTGREGDEAREVRTTRSPARSRKETPRR
jgi:hypothetical protein